MTNFEPMHIVSLTVDNVMRVSAVHIEPNGNVVILGGNNGHGKTSVLDAIWMALSSKREHGKKNPEPVHRGAKSGSIYVDLGQLRVTRTWNAEARTTKLTVTDEAGRAYQSPAKLLDELMGHGFDPLAFMRLAPRDQVVALLEIVDIDLDLEANARERAQLFEVRQEAGRAARFARHRVEQLPEVTIGPGWNLDTNLLQAEARTVQAHATDVGTAVNAHARVENEIGHHQRRVAELETELEQARHTLKTAETIDLTAAAIAVETAKTAAADDRHIDEITGELAAIAERSEIVRQHHELEVAIADAAILTKEHSSVDEQVKGLDQARSDAIAAAAMPIDGLSFDEDGLTFHGLPLTQASQAEQIRVCVAIAIAGDPIIRVARVADGSLLDDASMALLGELAEEHNFQVFVETVGDHHPAAIVIEDGCVRP